MGPGAIHHGLTAAKGVAALAVLGYLGIVAVLYVMQEQLIFPASALPLDYRFAFDQPFEEMRIPVAGASLDALHFTQPNPRGLAAYLARAVNLALLVLVTPYTSLAAASKRAYPFAPEWILKYPLRTDAIIGEVKSPVLLVHGTRDTLIPLADSEQLRSLARSPAELLVVDGAGHNDIHQFPTYLNGLAARLNHQ